MDGTEYRHRHHHHHHRRVPSRLPVLGEILGNDAITVVGQVCTGHSRQPAAWGGDGAHRHCCPRFGRCPALLRGARPRVLFLRQRAVLDADGMCPNSCAHREFSISPVEPTRIAIDSECNEMDSV